MNFNYVLIVNHINNDIINIEEKKRKKKKLQHMKQGNVNLITLLLTTK